MMNHALFSLLGIALTLLGMIPYIISIKKGKTKPHVFSWVIWGNNSDSFFFYIILLPDVQCGAKATDSVQFRIFGIGDFSPACAEK